MKWRLRDNIKNFVWQKLWSHSMTQRHQSLSAFSIVTDAIFFHLVRCLYTSSFLLFWSHEMRIKVCVEELCECSRPSRDLSREKKVLWEGRRRRKRRELTIQSASWWLLWDDCQIRSERFFCVSFSFFWQRSGFPLSCYATQWSRKPGKEVKRSRHQRERDSVDHTHHLDERKRRWKWVTKWETEKVKRFLLRHQEHQEANILSFQLCTFFPPNTVGIKEPK